jgi:hypothetical protein
MTEANRPFSIKIFYPKGLSNGIRSAEMTNWIGRCTYFPRGSLTQIKEYEEFGKPGVYILIGTETSGSLQTVYIGEGDPISSRIISHESKKDWWDSCIMITSINDWLNKTQIQFIESSLIKSAQSASRCIMDNKVIPESPTISATDKADAELFLDNAKICILPLGLDIFTSPLNKEATKNSGDNIEELYLDSKGLHAKGCESPDGFIVKNGSQCSITESEGLEQIDRARRTDLLKLGVLAKDGDTLVFTKDYRFTSPTLAARAVLGAPAPGPLRWKNKDGITLRDIRESSIKL